MRLIFKQQVNQSKVSLIVKMSTFSCSCLIKAECIKCEDESITHIKQEEQKVYTCDIWATSFEFVNDLNCHLKSHNENTCSKPTRYQVNKMYNCDFCEASFSHKGNFEKHRRTHTGEKPFVF